MSQFFGPARPPGKRYKILLCGESGTGKTLSALGFPRCACIDNHGSTGNYQAGYPDHRYFPKEGQVATVDLTTQAVTSLLGDPGDRLTLVIDDITTYNNQVDFKWNNLFFVRQEGGKGHHREYYSNQPNDYIHPKREKNAFIRKCLALDMNVIIIARMKKLYAGAVGGADFMKVIGQTFDGDPNLIYEFDYAFQLVKENIETRFVRSAELMGKQRVPTGGKAFPDRFEFEITQDGRSTFFDVFKQYVVMPAFETPAHEVQDPEKEVVASEGVAEKPVAAAAGPDKVVAAASSPAATAEPPQQTTKPPTDNSGCVSITEEQIEKILALRKKYKIEKSAWDAKLAEFNVTSAKDMSKEQAEKFIIILEEQVPF